MFDAPKLLFVDRNNTWASPIAEAAFQMYAKRLGLDIRSASVGLSREYAGQPANWQIAAFAQKHGLDISEHRARQLRLQDLRHFSHIVALDRDSLAMLRAMNTGDLSLLDDHAEQVAEMTCDLASDDPADLATVWGAISSGARGLAADIAAGICRPPIGSGNDLAVTWV